MRFFQGSRDDSAVIVFGILPNSNIVFSTPVEFSENQSAVFIEGSLEQLCVLHRPLLCLLKKDIDEALFGEWVGLSPPDEQRPRIILHYVASAGNIDKIRLLSFVLPDHLVKFCNLCLAQSSRIVLKIQGRVVQESKIEWPLDFIVGKKDIFGKSQGRIIMQ